MSGAILRPCRAGIAGHIAMSATIAGVVTVAERVSSATSEAHPAIARHPGVISLHGAGPVSDLCWPIVQSDIPAIADTCSFCIVAQGLDA